MRRARQVVSAHVRWHWYVDVGCRADQARRHFQIPQLRRTEGLYDLRTGLRCTTTIENAVGFALTHRIRLMSPPLRCFSPRFVKARHPVWRSKAHVQSKLTRGDDGPRPLVYLASGFVLVEALVNKGLQKISGLRSPSSDGPRNIVCQGIRVSEVVGLFIFEEGGNVTERRKPDTQHIRIFCSKENVVTQRRIETIPQTISCRIRGARKRVCCATAGPCPFFRRYSRCAADNAIDGFSGMRDKRGLGCIHAGRLVWNLVVIDDHGLRIHATGVEDPANHSSRNR